MTYSSCFGGGCRDYSSSSANRLDNVVNKFYVNIGSLNVNNGIQHSIAAEKTGDIHVYNTNIESMIGQQNNQVINMDNRKIEFISPYIGNGKDRYVEKKNSYLLPAPRKEYAANSVEYHNTITSGLLKPARPATQFIDDAEEIKDIVTETFATLTGQNFPDNIVVRVCSDEEMRKAHAANGGKWSNGIMGFAINRWPYPSNIFIRNNHLDELMLTVGHELGHVLSQRLPDDVDEEAKAFAFELAWASTIIDNNIGNLGRNFNTEFMPAENGLHDKAFAFVQKTVKLGKEALRVFWELAKGLLRTAENI